jgi:hypothetical protein
LYLIVLLAALAFAASWAASQARGMRDQSEVARMTAEKKTICIGRYLIDVPAKSEVSFSGTMLNGFDIVTEKETESAFRKRIEEREAEIAVHRTDANCNSEGGMEKARDLRIPGMVGRTFIYGRSRGYLMEGERRVDLESVSVEVHAHMNGRSVSLAAQSTEEASAEEAETLLARIHIRREDELPAAAGFCVPDAIFVDPLPAHKNEHLVMHLGLADHPDLSFTLMSLAGTRPGPALLARVARADATTGAEGLFRMTTLREGKRRISGIDGEELLLRAREFNLKSTYGFVWEAPGAVDDPALPLLSMELRTGIGERSGGEPVESSLHEDALLNLWDSITSSIRPRQAIASPLPTARAGHPARLAQHQPAH